MQGMNTPNLFDDWGDPLGKELHAKRLFLKAAIDIKHVHRNDLVAGVGAFRRHSWLPRRVRVRHLAEAFPIGAR